MSALDKQYNNMKSFYVIWFGQLISTLGSGLTGFALGIWLYQETHSVTLFAYNSVAYMIPGILLSPLAGVLVDRYNRRTMMILSDVGAGLTTMLIWYLFLTGDIQPWHIILTTFMSSAFTTFQWPAYSAATTMLVPQDQLGRAGGMSQIGEAVSHLISPVLAGGLLLTVGMDSIIAIDLLTFLFAVGTLFAIRIPQPKESAAGKSTKGSFKEDLVFGWKYIMKRKGLLYLLLYFASINFVSGVFGPLLMPFLLELGNPQQAGLVISSIGFGMLLGTIIQSTWGGSKKKVYTILGAGIWQGATVIIMGAEASLIMVAVAGFLLMTGMPLMNGSSQALWQTKTEPDVQGRVFAVRRMIAQFTSPISALMIAPLIDNFFQPAMSEGGRFAATVGKYIGVGPGRGTALVFVLVGILTIIFSLIGFAIPRLRNVEEELPDVIVEENEEPINDALPEMAS